MNPETKICQNCKQNFTIEAEDFDFYKKIDVPPPTWCPDCRLQRRMIWWNERNLYHIKDAVSGKEILSGTHGFSGAKAVDKDYWFSDNWDQNAPGMDYDWEESFFLQFKRLLKNALIPSRFVVNLVNSDYCNNASDIKDSYLIFGCTFIEDSAYSGNSTQSRQLFDSSYITDSEVSYESIFNKKCFRAFFSSYCESSYDIYFCRDCIGCENCFGCVGLRNKKYHIFNKPYSKEEYEEELNKFRLNSHSSLEDIKKKVRDFWLKFPVRYVRGQKNERCTGEYISNSKNVRESYYVNDGENLKYCQGLYSKGARDSYDHFRYGLNSELVYEATASGNHISRIKFCFEAFQNCSDVQYSFVVNNSSHMFGCVGMHHKQYCILNKQYSKEEYEDLVPKIIKHMDEMPYIDDKKRVYKYGEFFPPELSLYPYNDTVAEDFFPLSEVDAISKGFVWRSAGKRNYGVDISCDKLPDDITEEASSADFENKVVSCAHAGTCADHCTTAFRLTPQELQFYQAMRLPLPRLCPNCRYAMRVAQRNPIKLFKRKCQCAGRKSENGVYQNTAKHSHGTGECPNEFESSYSPDRKDIVYCEQCYNKEVV
ncbi:MAG: hypothetical protein ABSF47_01575 [Minisyncoccia bacterium]|jgi:hypothetical protein